VRLASRLSVTTTFVRVCELMFCSSSVKLTVCPGSALPVVVDFVRTYTPLLLLPTAFVGTAVPAPGVPAVADAGVPPVRLTIYSDETRLIVTVVGGLLIVVAVPRNVSCIRHVGGSVDTKVCDTVAMDVCPARMGFTDMITVSIIGRANPAAREVGLDTVAVTDTARQPVFITAICGTMVWPTEAVAGMPVASPIASEARCTVISGGVIF